MGKVALSGHDLTLKSVHQRTNSIVITAARVICFTMLLAAFSSSSSAEDFTNAIHAFLQHRGESEKRPGGIVVGLVDEHGSSVIAYGKLDNGTDEEVNGETVFGLHSQTCIYTALLLVDMIERGEITEAKSVVALLRVARKLGL